MRVFLDVGAHVGNTVRAALEPRWAFDRVWAFEPTSACLGRLREIHDERLCVVDAGWWSSDTELDIHSPGTTWGSLLADPSSGRPTERCQLIDAAAWIADNIDLTDSVWLKINIEGAEAEVLQHLIVSGEIRKIDHLVVHFDIERVDKQRDATMLRRDLDEVGIEWREPRQVMFGRDDAAKLRSWLAWTNGRRFEFQRRRAEHEARAAVWAIRKRFRHL